MPFNIPDDTVGSGGEYLDRIQYDARVGFWQVVHREQAQDGSWGDQKGEQFKGISFLADFGTIEIGYIRFSSPPAFLVVPLGKPLPPQPEEMTAGGAGEAARRAFLPGFRLKVASPRHFGNNEPHYFAATSKAVRNSVEGLFDDFLTRPEAAQGLIPVVVSKSNTATVTKNKQGTSTFYGPTFEIVTWAERPEAFGPRTVPVPAAGQRAAPPPPPPAAPPRQSTTPPSQHPGIPQPAYAQHLAYPPPPPAAPPPGHPAAAQTGMPDFNEIPY